MTSTVHRLKRKIRVWQTRQTNVAMLHVGRCGSTVVGDMLNLHTNIHWASELFSDFSGRYPDSEHSLQSARQILRDDMLVTNKPVYGFETNFLPNQQLGSEGIDSDLPEYLELLRKCGVTQYIILTRKNLLRRAVSVQVGVAAGLWHTSSEVKKPSTVNMPDPARMPEWFARVEKEHQRLITLLQGQSCLSLVFEDDISADPRIAYRRVCEFLGQRDEDPEVKLKKTNSFPIRNLVVNFDEVVDAFRGTDYEWMLDS